MNKLIYETGLKIRTEICGQTAIKGVENIINELEQILTEFEKVSQQSKWKYPEKNQFPKTHAILDVNIIIKNIGCSGDYFTLSGYYSCMTKCFHNHNHTVINNVIAWSYLPVFNKA